MGTKVAPITLKYVETVGCVNDCDYEIKINDGIPLPCKEWTNEESRLLRERMLIDNQLMTSGFVRRVEASNLGNSRRIRQSGIDVGPIRTQDSDIGAVNECKTTYEGIRIKDFEKTFYIVNTQKNLEMCIKDFIGTRWQDFISDRHSEYNADDFANTDLADIIVAAIIEEFNDFLPKFMLLAVCGSAAHNMNGDDGIMAKAYYASKGQYFHTLEFDLTAVGTAGNTYINAITGGAKYTEDPADFNTTAEYILNFVEWINTRRERRYDIYNASYDDTSKKLYVAANFATRLVDLRIVLNDGETVDWGCKSSLAAQLAPRELQNAMLINDVPLLFQYEAIDETNFAQKFRQYKTAFKQYIRRNGFENITDADILIGIDPELLDAREAQTQDEIIDGNFNVNFMNQAGLTLSQFRPLNALNDTGLFFITVRENLLLLDDGSNADQMLDNMGRIRIKESCDNEGMIKVLGGTPPVGSEVEAWGLFASNLTGSWFVIDNDLENKEPCEHAKLNLVCYDYNVKNHCVVEASCEIACNVTTAAVYDEVGDQTTITVTVNTNTPTGTTLVYDLAYALSDGTGQEGITTNSFIITLPGNQTDDGLALTVTGTVTAEIAAVEQCKTYVNYSEKFGTGDGFSLCVLTDTNDQVANIMTAELSVTYSIDGTVYNVALTNAGLDYDNPADYPAIELELEDIFPDTEVTISQPAANNVQIVISGMPSFITNVTVNSGTTSNKTAELVADCD